LTRGDPFVIAELAEAIRARKVSAEELVRASLEKIERENGSLNAVVAVREQGLDEARALDRALVKGLDAGPLAGIPMLVKDIEDVAGMRTTFGSLLCADARPAPADCLVVERLRSAGAIVVGKTNVPEFAFEGYTANRLFGPTRNPWSPDWSPGGSSGGSAAAVAAGFSPIATATDGGGSIRIPASFCGLVGLKPTNGIVARDPVRSGIDLSTSGPLGYSIEDVELLLQVEAGPAPGDPSALPRWDPDDGWDPEDAPLPSRVFAAPRLVDWGPLPDAVEEMYLSGLKRLEQDLGLVVEPLEPHDIFRAGNPDEDWYILVCTEQLYELGRATIEENAELFDPVFLEYMRFGLSISAERYVTTRRRRFAYVKEMDSLLGDNGILVTPTMPVEGFSPDGRMVGKEKPGTTGDAYNTVVANMTGHPALTVPAGVMKHGVPFGLQFMGPRFRDRLLLKMGREWERRYPWPRTAPGFELLDY
jgi:Asp-tRNA(Asn)/Glu-tRNA(Gln) amidotransferase A subunit family amidase